MMILIGLILPPLIGFITRTVKDSDGRFWASVAVCVVFGVFYDFVLKNGWIGYAGLTLVEIAESLAESVMVMIGTAKVSYEAFWNNEAVGTKLTEDKTILKAMNLKSSM